jgi:hypothetical protein
MIPEAVGTVLSLRGSQFSRGRAVRYTPFPPKRTRTNYINYSEVNSRK